MDFDIDEMLMNGEVPSQGEVLKPEFKEKFGLGKVHQLGLAVPDVVEAAHRLEGKGIGPFFIAEDDLAFWVERGEKKSFHGKLGIAFLGGYELELLEAGEGSTFYSDLFRDDGKIALHHIGLLDHNVDYREKQLNDAGIETGVRGKIKLGLMSVNFAYMNSAAEAGLIIEFIDYRLLGIPIRPPAGLMKLGAKMIRRLGINQLRMGKRD